MLTYTTRRRRPLHRRQSLHRAHRRRQTGHLASRPGRPRKSDGHHAHPRRRARLQDPGAHRAGPDFALRLGAGRRLHAPALRLRRLPLSRWRKEPLAVGHGAPRQRKPGSYTTGTSSATATTTAGPWATLSASPAASRCRRALPSAPGGRATGPIATRSSTSWCAASTRTSTRSTCW